MSSISELIYAPGPSLVKYFKAEIIGPAEATFQKQHFVGPLTFQPGEDMVYGVGLGTAGLLMEKIIGKDLNEILQENICKPLGLKKTRFDWREEDAKPEIYGRRETVGPSPGLLFPEVRGQYGDINSPWKLGTVTAKADACFGDSTLVSNAREYSTIMGEALKATQGKPNKLFTKPETGKQLLEQRYASRRTGRAAAIGSSSSSRTPSPLAWGTRST
jgi:CubicO group peptidase (beta-lactamase class C family)